MYHIAICEDEDAFICELKEQLMKYATETDKEFCFFVYHDGNELLQKYNLKYDLIFMDIRMKQMNGLKAAEEIRRMDSSVGLIFISSWKQYVWRGYEYSAVNYLLKPIKYGVLKMELDRYFAGYHGNDERFVSFSNDNGKYKIPYKNLRYAETSKRNVMLHFEGQKQIIYQNMKKISSMLCSQPQFVQCHQSFIVNLSFVKSVEGLELFLTTGERIPISQPRRKAFMEELAEYIGGRM